MLFKSPPLFNFHYLPCYFDSWPVRGPSPFLKRLPRGQWGSTDCVPGGIVEKTGEIQWRREQMWRTLISLSLQIVKVCQKEMSTFLFHLILESTQGIIGFLIFHDQAFPALLSLLNFISFTSQSTEIFFSVPAYLWYILKKALVTESSGYFPLFLFLDLFGAIDCWRPPPCNSHFLRFLGTPEF